MLKPERAHGLFTRSALFASISTTLAVLLFAPSQVRADSEAAPRSYILPTRNGKYEFVMRISRRGEPKNIERYKQSGLYLKGNPEKALWTVDWYAYKVFPASDGHHLVELGPWPEKGKEDELAVAFHRDGRLLRAIKINQLIQHFDNLPHSVAHFHWLKTLNYNDENRQFSVTTLEDKQFIFNASGEVLQGQLVDPTQPQSQFNILLRQQDIEGLLNLGPTALPELIEAVRNGKDRRRDTAILALAASGRAALPELEKLSRDAQPDLRLMAAEALKNISVTESQPILEAMLKDSEVNVRIAAIGGLAEIHALTPGAPATREARRILWNGSDNDKNRLLYTLADYRLPVLIPDVLHLLESPQPDSYGRVGMGLASNVNGFLERTTFQELDQLVHGRNNQEDLAQLWKQWWELNRHRSTEDWYSESIRRDMDLQLGRLLPPIHLHQLTGRRGNDRTQWQNWWQTHKTQRPGQILIAALKAEQTNEFGFNEGWYQLVNQTDTQDLADLIDLYKNTVPHRRIYVEKAIRHLTDVESYGIPHGGQREQALIKAWKQVAAG